MVEADRGGEVHFGAQRLKEVGPAGDARYSAGVQETGFLWGRGLFVFYRRMKWLQKQERQVS